MRTAEVAEITERPKRALSVFSATSAVKKGLFFGT